MEALGCQQRRRRLSQQWQGPVMYQKGPGRVSANAPVAEEGESPSLLPCSSSRRRLGARETLRWGRGWGGSGGRGWRDAEAEAEEDAPEMAPSTGESSGEGSEEEVGCSIIEGRMDGSGADGASRGSPLGCGAPLSLLYQEQRRLALREEGPQGGPRAWGGRRLGG